jgi:hypothetical protein
MFSQKQTRYAFATLLVLLMSLALTLTACGGKSSIKGKWEQVSETPLALFFGGPGTLWEFFDDGTVSIGVMGNVSGQYSWPDNSHLKIEFQQGVGLVYEFAASGDEITLKDPSTQSVITLKRYREFPPTAQSLAGDWKKDTPDKSRCFLGLGLDSAPGQISFGADGTFSVQQEGGFFSNSISLYGQFSTSGNSLNISATGTKNKAQIGGEMSCQVTVSHTRLLFKDDQGHVTLYVRSQK